MFNKRALLSTTKGDARSCGIRKLSDCLIVVLCIWKSTTIFILYLMTYSVSILKHMWEIYTTINLLLLSKQCTSSRLNPKKKNRIYLVGNFVRFKLSFYTTFYTTRIFRYINKNPYKVVFQNLPLIEVTPCRPERLLSVMKNKRTNFQLSGVFSLKWQNSI